jgi:hypothetical protein
MTGVVPQRLRRKLIKNSSNKKSCCGNFEAIVYVQSNGSTFQAEFSIAKLLILFKANTTLFSFMF